MSLAQYAVPQRSPNCILPLNNYCILEVVIKFPKVTFFFWFSFVHLPI